MPYKPMLPPIKQVYESDVNLLHFLFDLARDDKMLLQFLNNLIFIREHPALTEALVRRELAVQDLIKLPKSMQ